MTGWSISLSYCVQQYVQLEIKKSTVLIDLCIYYTNYLKLLRDVRTVTRVIKLVGKEIYHHMHNTGFNVTHYFYFLPRPNASHFHFAIVLERPLVCKHGECLFSSTRQQFSEAFTRSIIIKQQFSCDIVGQPGRLVHHSLKVLQMFFRVAVFKWHLKSLYTC